MSHGPTMMVMTPLSLPHWHWVIFGFGWALRRSWASGPRYFFAMSALRMSHAFGAAATTVGAGAAVLAAPEDGEGPQPLTTRIRARLANGKTARSRFIGILRELRA